MSYYQCKYDDCDKIFLHKDSYVKHFKKKHGDNLTYNTLSDHHRKIYINSFYIRTYKHPETIRFNIKRLLSTKSSLTDEEFKNQVNNAINNNLILHQNNEQQNIDNDEGISCYPCTVPTFPVSLKCEPVPITAKVVSSAKNINCVMPKSDSTLSFGKFNDTFIADTISDKLPNNFPKREQVVPDLFNLETEEKLEEKESQSPKKRKSFVINLSDEQLKNSRVIYNLENISMKEMNDMLNGTKKFKNIDLSDNNFINNKSNYFVKNVEKFYKNDLDTIFNLEEYINYLLYNF
jgi:hypothetical protein